MATGSKTLTYDEWLTLPEVEGVEEVVDGVIQKKPPNKWNHTRIVEALARQFIAQLDRESAHV